MNLTHLMVSSTVVFGEFVLFVGHTLQAATGFFRRGELFFRQCAFIGYSSLGIITVAAFFLGGVMGYQLYVSLHFFGAEALLGGSIGVGLYRELAPVMAAIMVIGRAAAAMAAELASMRLTEQIDALEVMAVDPMEYLVVPRVSAGLLMMPIICVYFGTVGCIAAAVVACGVMDLSFATYYEQLVKFTDPIDLVHCTVKGAVFGLLLTWIGCFFGFRAKGGARSVGLATRTTVVVSCLAILAADYIITSVLPITTSTLKVF